MSDSVLELEGTWEEVRSHDAELTGCSVYLAARRDALAEVELTQRRPPTPREVMAMSPEARKRTMQEAALIAAPIYDADLALLPADRELTALSALDGKDFIGLD
jgi:hypothetical protein